MSTESIQWPELDPAEIDIAEFDYALYANGAALNAAVPEVRVLRGTDASPELALVGPVTISGHKVYQSVRGRTAGVHYKLRMRAVFADGREKVLAGSWLCVLK
jgi:hypothetical protein